MGITEIKRLCEQHGYTAEERGRLVSAAKELGIEIPQCGCVDKWNDLAVEVYKAVRARLGTSGGVFYQYVKSYTVVSENVRYNGNTPISQIERLKRGNRPLFKELYKERVSI